MKMKSIPGAVLGIIGAVFAVIGTLNLGLCAELVDAATGGITSYTWMAYVFGFCGAAAAIVGAVLDFSKPIIGGVLQFVGAAFILAISIIMFFSWANIIALALLVIGAILSFAVRKAV